MRNYYTDPRGFVFRIPLGFSIIYDYDETFIFRPGDADCLSTTPFLREPDHTNSLVPRGHGSFFIIGQTENSNVMRFFEKDRGIELDKRDVIFGSESKLKQEMKKVLKKNPKLLIFLDCCMDKVRGECPSINFISSKISCPFLIDRNQKDSILHIGETVLTYHQFKYINSFNFYY